MARLEDGMDQLTTDPAKLSLRQLQHACSLLDVSASGGDIDMRMLLSAYCDRVLTRASAGSKAQLIQTLYKRKTCA